MFTTLLYFVPFNSKKKRHKISVCFVYFHSVFIARRTSFIDPGHKQKSSANSRGEKTIMARCNNSVSYQFFFPAHDSYLSCANKVDILSNDLTNKMKSVLLKRFRFSRIATKNVKRIFSTCSFLRNFGHRHNFFPLSLSPSLHNPMCTFIIHCFRIVCQMFSFILLLFWIIN